MQVNDSDQIHISEECSDCAVENTAVRTANSSPGKEPW